MTQFTHLSEQAQEIINLFFNKTILNGKMENQAISLGASLYSLLPDAQPAIVDGLKQHIISLCAFLNDEQISILKSEYKSVLLYCFDTNTEQYLRWSHTIPSHIVELTLKLAKPEKNSTIYMPYAGLGEYIRELEWVNCVGKELSSTNWAISEIIRTLTNNNGHISRMYDPIERRIGNKKHGYIFACPPFFQMDEVVYNLIYFLEHNLEKGGEMYVVVPSSVCYATRGSAGFDLRKVAMDLNVSTSVIALPKNSFYPKSAAETCLIAFKSDGKGQCLFIDFSDQNYTILRDMCGYKTYQLKVDAVIESLTSFDERTMWKGTHADLKSSLSWYPKRYLPIDEENVPTLSPGEKLVKLGDLITMIPTYRLPSKSMKPLIGNRELSDDYLNCTISAMGNFSSEREALHVIKEKCLLVGFIGGKIKVGRMEDVSELHSVALRQEIFPFAVTSEEATEDYILRSLMCDFSRQQANRFATGAVITRISFKDLCEIEIVLPSLEEQNRICYNDAHASIKEADIALQQAYDDFRKDIHMKKHAMGQTVANIENWWGLLETIRLQSNGVIDDSVEVGRIRKFTLKEILDRIHASISKLSTQLNKFDTGYGLAKEELALTEFIEEYISSNTSPLFRYEYNSLQHRLSDDILDIDAESGVATLTGNHIRHKGDPIEYIKFPKAALSTIFDNIVSNACAHGFAGREGVENIIRIEIDSDGTDYIVEISNNGQPLDPAMSTEGVTTYGQTSGDTMTHSGIGGYEVKRLMEEFGDKVEIIADANSDFPIKYRLVFHDTNINSILI